MPIECKCIQCEKPFMVKPYKKILQNFVVMNVIGNIKKENQKENGLQKYALVAEQNLQA